MSSRAVDRAGGVKPWQTSALANTDVVFRHAGDAAFLWTLRDAAVAAPHYALKDLAALDERVEAHLDGLRVAGRLGWELSQANLANEGPGEVFVVGVLAFGTGESPKMRDSVNAGCTSPKLLPGLISALGWLEFERVAPWLEMLVNARAPLHRRIGIAAHAIHRRDPGAALQSSIEDPDIFLRARALRAVGQLRQHGLADRLQGHLNDENDVCRFWAAWSLTLLGKRDGISTLLRSGEADSSVAVPALQVALRALSPADSRGWLSSFASQSSDTRLTIFGTGIIGDPATVPWLIKKMESPALARLAGEAFTMITGIDLAYHDLSQDAPPPPEGESAETDDAGESPMGYQSELPWPSPSLIADWWDRNRKNFASGTRYLGGQPISTQSALELLAKGPQRQRAAAALELALLDATDQLWEIRAPGRRQQERLAALIPSAKPR